MSLMRKVGDVDEEGLTLLLTEVKVHWDNAHGIDGRLLNV